VNFGDELRFGMARHFDAWSETSSFLASLKLDTITHILDGSQPAPAIGAAIAGGQYRG